MKFIIDAQLPKSLSNFLNSKGFDSIHTLNLPSKNLTNDNYINSISLKENRVLISKDKDFLNSYILKSIPNKLILVVTGNIHNRQLLKIFDDNILFIVEKLQNYNLIQISKTEITVHI